MTAEYSGCQSDSWMNFRPQSRGEAAAETTNVVDALPEGSLARNDPRVPITGIASKTRDGRDSVSAVSTAVPGLEACESAAVQPSNRISEMALKAETISPSGYHST